MEPIYFPVANNIIGAVLFTLMLLGLVTAIFSAGFLGVFKMMTVIFALGVLVFIGSLGTLSVNAVKYSSDRESAKNQRIELVENTYGLPISNETYEKLNYPDKLPEADKFSSYGTALITTDESGKVQQLQVTLLWTGTEFQLATNETGSTELKELPRKN